MRFSLNISAEQYQSYYVGAARFVRVETDDGRSLRFPASELRRFITHEGVQGRFEITFDRNQKLLSLERI